MPSWGWSDRERSLGGQVEDGGEGEAGVKGGHAKGDGEADVRLQGARRGAGTRELCE